MANKIELMHRIFGKNEKLCCIECSHFKRKTYGSRTYRKCEVYGDSNSTGTDWKASYIACGLAPWKAYTGRQIVELARAKRKSKDDGISGQMKMFT